MPIFSDSAKDIVLPKFYHVQQCFLDECLENIPDKIHCEFQKEEIRSSLREDATAALLVGSRGIASINVIVKAVVSELIRLGVKPFIVPAMGSHGGGVSEEQAAVLARYGITEKLMAAPIRSSMETSIIGYTKGGVPVHVDCNALSADFIIPINRVKPHTDFDGSIESGLCKMLSIGLGKHRGCSRLHQEGFANFPTLLPEVASVVMKHCAVPFGVAVVENAHEHVHTIRLLPGERIICEEPKLLELSKSLMPRLCFDHIDVLIVDQIGKDITGAGMDPNITGRVAGAPQSPFYSGPSISRIVINRLTENSHGNATGMGVADFITKAMYEQIDLATTYTNLIASCVPENARIPIIMDNEEQALIGAILTCKGINKNEAKVVRIKDTLHLIDIEVSESLLPWCLSHPQFIVK